MFFAQLARMAGAGLPLPAAMANIARIVGKTPLGRALPAMATTLQTGATLAQAMATEPHCFDAVEIALIDAAQQTGHVPATCERIAKQIAETQAQQNALQKAMAYPIFLAATACVLGPIKKALTESMHAYLVAAGTQTAVLLGAVLLIWFGIPAFFARPAVKTAAMAFALRVPGLRAMMLNRRYSLLFSVLGHGVDVGLPLGTALELGARAAGDPVFQAQVPLVLNALARGDELHSAVLLLSGLDAESAGLIAAAEQTGHLSETFAELGEQRRQAFQKNVRLASLVFRYTLTAAVVVWTALSVVHQFQSAIGSEFDEIDRAEGSGYKQLKKVLEEQ